jgi:hypothetical protein
LAAHLKELFHIDLCKMLMNKPYNEEFAKLLARIHAFGCDQWSLFYDFCSTHPNFIKGMLAAIDETDGVESCIEWKDFDFLRETYRSLHYAGQLGEDFQVRLENSNGVDGLLKLHKEYKAGTLSDVAPLALGKL